VTPSLEIPSFRFRRLKLTTNFIISNTRYILLLAATWLLFAAVRHLHLKNKQAETKRPIISFANRCIYVCLCHLHEGMFAFALVNLLLALFHGYFMNVLSAFSFFGSFLFLAYIYYMLRFAYRKTNSENKSD
jgi:hypothetical protein